MPGGVCSLISVRKTSDRQRVAELVSTDTDYQHNGAVISALLVGSLARRACGPLPFAGSLSRFGDLCGGHSRCEKIPVVDRLRIAAFRR